jgi:peptidoglycan/xylan/chitin deacetylase (PgdA/CDA1 family)
MVDSVRWPTDMVGAMKALSRAEFLYGRNTPANFWRVVSEPEPSESEWAAATQASARALGMGSRRPDAGTADLLADTLGEGQFGAKHWDLGMATRLYYLLKPAIPRAVSRRVRRIHRLRAEGEFLLRWPVEDRYARFQWTLVRYLMQITGKRCLPFVNFWPEGHRFALVLTHDVETATGQRHVGEVADLEEQLGFRSSFNFVPERYRVDTGLIRDLRGRGFEIGIHGLKHDGRLFWSKTEFMRRAGRINRHLARYDAVGFRSPLMHRNPEWMQALDIEYDLSFFDTDPYEPIPGGTTSIWPFMLGRFVELPYTLVQDYTLTDILEETSARIWMEKLEFIERYCGMALVNTHPDYLRRDITWRVYVEFLEGMKSTSGYWHPLPREAASWWRARAEKGDPLGVAGATKAEVRLSDGDLVIDLQGDGRVHTVQENGRGRQVEEQGEQGARQRNARPAL